MVVQNGVLSQMWNEVNSNPKEKRQKKHHCAVLPKMSLQKTAG
jgi:hypothetical protein